MRWTQRKEKLRNLLKLPRRRLWKMPGSWIRLTKKSRPKTQRLQRSKLKRPPERAGQERKRKRRRTRKPNGKSWQERKRLPSS